MAPRNANQPKRETTGQVSVYVKWEGQFHGTLRPCYDSGPDFWGELTDKQVRTLRGLISRYVSRCHAANSTQEENA